MCTERIALLQNLAVERGGQCTVRFSQSLEPVRSWIGLHEETKEGVCRTLVIRWFVQVVKAQPKFWSGVFDRQGRLNGAFFGTIMVQSVNPGRINVAPQGHPRIPGEAAAGSLQPLLAQGFNLTMNNHGNPTTGTNATKTAAEFVTKIESAAKKHAQFKFVVLLGLKRSSSGGGHAIGIMPSADGAALLMDPNLGEFAFPTVGSLVAWMTEDLAHFYDKYDALTYAVFKK